MQIREKGEIPLHWVSVSISDRRGKNELRGAHKRTFKHKNSGASRSEIDTRYQEGTPRPDAMESLLFP